MKKTCTIILVMSMIFSMFACGEQQNNKSGSSNVGEAAVYDISDLESMLKYVRSEGENAEKNTVNEKDELLKKLGNSYDTYDKNKFLVSKFYDNTMIQAKELYTSIHTVSIDYYKCVASHGIDDYDTWNENMDSYYDVWDEVMDEYYDAWDEAYNDIYDECDSLIEDGYDELDYNEYSDIWSEMYSAYSDAWSAMYNLYSDAWSKNYDIYSTVWSGFYNEETDIDAILKASEEKSDENDNESDSEISENNDEDEKTISNAKPTDEEEQENGDFRYIIYDDGTIELTKYIGNDTNVTISSEIDGYPVGRIGESAFEGCKNIESIIMWPDPISIGKSAFEGCSSLKSFSLPSSVTVINDFVFKDCSSLESIILWGDVTSIGKSAFENCTSLLNVSIPSSCLLVDESAFEGCTKMESLIIWGGNVIGNSAFKGCSSLTSISIPSDVISIGECAFMDCTCLQSVTIWGDNVNIGINAFSGCTSLDRLPEGAANTDPRDDEILENIEDSPAIMTEETTMSAEKTKITSTNTSEFERAFIRKLPTYDLYLMFDTDINEVVSFSSEGEYDLTVYSGELSEGVKICWEDGWYDEFIYKTGSNKAILIDGNGFEWEYEVCDVTTAQKILDKIK